LTPAGISGAQGSWACSEMKAQTDSNSRGHKDLICREFICREEKRKTAYWGMQGYLETCDPLSQGGECVL
jgi:hypothetical protein